MSLSEENIDLFDLYLREDLSSSEKEEIHARLKSDSVFKKEFDGYMTSVNALETLSIGEEMGDIIGQVYEKKSVSWRIPAAAAVILMILIPTIYQGYFRSGSDQELFTAYYTPYPPAQNVRGNQQSDRGMVLYRNNEYSAAIPLFESQIAADSTKARIHLFLGNCYLRVNNTAKAIEHLEKLLLVTNSRIIQQNTEWYLALAYLKEGGTQETVEQLQSIVSSNHLFSEKAKDLLKELE